MQGAQPLIIHSLYRCIYVVGLKGSEFRFLPIHDRQTFKLFRQYIISGIVLEDYVINGNKLITLRSFSVQVDFSVMSWSDIEASQWRFLVNSIIVKHNQNLRAFWSESECNSILGGVLVRNCGVHFEVVLSLRLVRATGKFRSMEPSFGCFADIGKQP